MYAYSNHVTMDIQAQYISYGAGIWCNVKKRVQTSNKSFLEQNWVIQLATKRTEMLTTNAMRLHP